MQDDELTLDGNAAAGVLSELFAAEVTSVRGACAWCGAVAAVAEQRLYQNPQAPGGVLRCHACEGAMMVFVRRGEALRVGIPGVRWLDVG
jgi:hypothetical protein